MRAARPVVAVLSVVVAFFVSRAFTRAEGASAAFPAASVDDSLTPEPGRDSIVVAGGCFWGVQAVFQHTRGVLRATSGYAGGSARNPSYELVSSGSTGHAESVEVVFDRSQISLGQLLKVFFAVAHDPTELNRQGPDEGTQYRSMILVSRDRQASIARSYWPPSSSSGAVGRAAPARSTSMRSLPIPLPIRYVRVDSARAWDSRWLASRVPVLSV